MKWHKEFFIYNVEKSHFCHFCLRTPLEIYIDEEVTAEFARDRSILQMSNIILYTKNQFSNPYTNRNPTTATVDKMEVMTLR